MTTLHRLAREAGLLIDWMDATGRKQCVADDTLVAILNALALPADSESVIEDSRKRLRADESTAAGKLVTTEIGIPVELPGRGPTAFETPGYYEVEGTTVAVAPKRAWTVADAARGRRIWGAAVQIPSLRDAREEPFGDFGALAAFARSAAAHGADALAVSPVHALFPSDPGRYSPYGPSSRLFLNVWLADPSLLGGGSSTLPSEDPIDWQAAIPERLQRLRRLFDRRDDVARENVETFRRQSGEELELHALYDALYDRFGAGWRNWPAEYHDPRGEAVSAFAAANREDVDFYVFLQWLADRSLAAAQSTARQAGMAVGLIADLAVGMDAGGSHAWSRPDRLLKGLSVGAPPDPFGPDGQDWGLTTFSPRGLKRSGFADFIATIRAAVRHAGGIRIDHAMSLRRLWVVPHGASAKDGAYLLYPEQDLMRLLALESWLARAIVIGEDLGTVPEGFREEMEARGMLGMRVLWFERTRGGGFKAPEKWDRAAAAMTSTHDLPTVAGWWSGRDIDWTWKIGRTSAFESEEEERSARQKDRERLWRACRKAGSPSGPVPPPDAPEAAVDAAIAYTAAAPSDLAIIPAEDLIGEPEQPNLPGTIDEHPNWRRRLPGRAEDMLDRPEVAARIERLNQARRK